MTKWSQNPEASAEALSVSVLDELALGAGARVLVAYGAAGLLRALAVRECDVATWHRRTTAGITAHAAPPDGPFTCALLRLPKSRDEQIMAVHLCLGALAAVGRLIIYGGNDEGVRTFQKTLATLGTVTTLATRGHGRVLDLKRAHVTAVIKARAAEWREVHATPGHGDWISYPGLFAGGAPDAGTALLLAHLPPLAVGAAVLDYGCGPGAIGAAIHATRPGVSLTLLDNDSLALAAAAENVSNAKHVLGDRLDAVAGKKFDLIVSNPPLHVGFKEDTGALLRLISEAPKFLQKGGQLLMVVQRRIALERSLAQSFGAVDVLVDDGRYRVWRGA